MEIRHVLGLAVFLTLTAFFIPVFVNAWRGGNRPRRIIERGMQLGYSHGAIVATLRCACGGILLFAFLIPAGILKSVARGMSGRESLLASRVLGLFADALMVAAVATIVGYAAAILFGRPKWVLPTALRKSSGLLTRRSSLDSGDGPDSTEP